MKTLSSFIAGLVAMPCLLLLSSCASQQLSIPAATAMINWTNSSSMLCVKICLEDGEEILFSVDTGCAHTILDKSLEPKLGRAIGRTKSKFVFRDRVTAKTFRAPKLFLGGTRLMTGSRILTDNLRPLFGDRPVYGILGMDCLRHYCIQLDFAGRNLRFLEPDDLNAGELGKPFPLILRNTSLTRFGEVTLPTGDGARAFTDASLFEEEDVRFWLDTGFSGSADFMLNPGLFKRTIRQHPKDSITIFSVTNNIGVSGAASFPTMSFAGEANRRVVVGELSRRLSGFEGWIGSRFLSRYLVTMNFPRKTLYLRQRIEPARQTVGSLAEVPAPTSDPQ